ncbi:hypothetical protein [Phycicoccus jejuensis]|uniref:hypothetical protein n=1 Tax=Phycicoccus jejuensis TaxID=367299 RepID=UPI001FE1C0FD|nr:hypothetical protein [Phycicoccus jejuensis]
MIWATRGHTWGFRFLLDAGRDDPLSDYERAFARDLDKPVVWRQVSELTAVRFPDPLGRRDTAGRVIPHEFVALGGLAASITSVDDGNKLLWPLVEHAYARIWSSDAAPTEGDLRFDG